MLISLNVDIGASEPLICPLGLIYGNDAASKLPNVSIDPVFVISIWIYAFRVDQEAYIFSMVNLIL